MSEILFILSSNIMSLMLIQKTYCFVWLMMSQALTDKLVGGESRKPENKIIILLNHSSQKNIVEINSFANTYWCCTFLNYLKYYHKFSALILFMFFQDPQIRLADPLLLLLSFSRKLCSWTIQTFFHFISARQSLVNLLHAKVTLDYNIFIYYPSIESIPGGNFWLWFSSFHMLYFCMLDGGRFLTLSVCGSI